MRLLGKDVTFYRFPAENHELSRSGSPVHRKMRAEIILDYFELAALTRLPPIYEFAGDRDPAAGSVAGRPS